MIELYRASGTLTVIHPVLMHTWLAVILGLFATTQCSVAKKIKWEVVKTNKF